MPRPAADFRRSLASSLSIQPRTASRDRPAVMSGEGALVSLRSSATATASAGGQRVAVNSTRRGRGASGFCGALAHPVIDRQSNSAPVSLSHAPPQLIVFVLQCNDVLFNVPILFGAY